jgi:predicted secreted protein
MVYLAANGVYKSTDYGATWQRIDDPKQPGTAAPEDIAITTHPQHMVVVDASGQLYRSVDDGATWQKAKSTTEPGGADVFVDGDSTRLYRATGQGLFFSSDAGDIWEPAAGVLGQVQTTALGYADADGHTILYAATNGGSAATTGGTLAAAPRSARTAATTLVGAGIYRYVALSAPKVTLKLSGLKKGSLKLGKRLTVTGKVTPATLAGSKVTLKVQKKKGHKWVTVKTVKRTIGHSGAYSWQYKPAKRGSYRLQLTIAKAVTHTAAKTTWRGFKVK